METKKIVLTFAVLVVLAVAFIGINEIKKINDDEIKIENSKILSKFSSCNALKASFQAEIERQNVSPGAIETLIGAMSPSMMATSQGSLEKSTAEESGSAQATTANDSSAISSERASNYSETNIQVKGVDEADIVKNDGQFIYTLNSKYNQETNKQENYLIITKAWPAEEMQIISKKDLENVNATEMFINENKLLIIGSKYYEQNYYGDGIMPMRAEKMIAPGYYPYYSNTSVVQVYNIENKENILLEKNIEFQGSYVSSRKINDLVYFVLSQYAQTTYYENSSNIKEVSLPAIKVDDSNFEKVCECTDIAYLQPNQAQNFILVASISMNSLAFEKQLIVGQGQSIYASQNNLYIAETEWSRERMPMVESLIRMPSTENTIIHKFNLDNGKINYQGYASARGRILNQFSMDEYNDTFRIATTQGNNESNNLFIFDKEMKQIGLLEGLAPGESIYSVRFMGEKAYVVTFKKIDPLFVIDLSNASEPKVLGKLKIPGYSDYLHPIDENHLIGLGKDAVPALEKQGDFAWYQGIKLAIFDVSNPVEPIEMFSTIIGDRGTESYALHDHKAFLFDKEKELLVIPVTLAEVSIEQKKQFDEQRQNEIKNLEEQLKQLEEQKGIEYCYVNETGKEVCETNSGYAGQKEWVQQRLNELKNNPIDYANLYGEYKYQGAYVYNVNLENGFTLKGKITHSSEQEMLKAGYYWNDEASVKRSLWMENVLYTVSSSKIKANSLDNLNEIKEIVLVEPNKIDEPIIYKDEMTTGSEVVTQIPEVPNNK